MTPKPAIHCPECGAYTRRERQDDGTEVLICTDDECPRVVAYVVSVPARLYPTYDPDSWRPALQAAFREEFGQ